MIDEASRERPRRPLRSSLGPAVTLAAAAVLTAVLFLTAAADQEGTRRIRERTACGFVSKPSEERAFIGEVRRLLLAAGR